MPLSALTDEALRNYLKSLNGHKPAELYQLVMGEVEKPLFKTVMDYTAGLAVPSLACLTNPG